jgi:hypothetical protein
MLMVRLVVLVGVLGLGLVRWGLVRLVVARLGWVGCIRLWVLMV